MDYQEAFNRLSNHSNFPQDENSPPEHSLVVNLWQATLKGRSVDIKDYVEEIILCLEVVNKFINGQKPSETCNKNRPDAQLVFVISTLISSMLEYSIIFKNKKLLDQNEIKEFDLAAWAISNAWCMILHGDIDSLSDELVIEKSAKGIN